MSLAINAKIYRNTATFGTPTWVAVSLFENVSVDPRYVESASNSRDSPFERVAATMAGCSITGRLKVKPGDAGYEALMDAFALRTPVDLLVLNAAKETEGARGVRGEFYVMAAGEDQTIQNRLYRDLELKLADTDNPPKWAKVSDEGALQYAEPGGSWA